MVTLEELQQSNARRLMQLAQSGTPVPIDGTFYLRRLLERLLGPIAVAEVQFEHESWLAEQLDNFESAVARARLMPGPGINPMQRNGH